jgi:hypothetical protein
MEKYLVIIIIVVIILIYYNYTSKHKFITSAEVQLQINEINKQLTILRNKHEYYLQYLTENEPNFNPLFKIFFSFKIILIFLTFSIINISIYYLIRI